MAAVGCVSLPCDGCHVAHPARNGWRVWPGQRLWKRLGVVGRQLYCKSTRSCVFSDKDEAVAAYEKFMAPSTSDVERKAMLYQPPEAYTCAHCGQTFKGRNRVCSRQNHERTCKEQSSSSSEEEESDEDESEEEEPEEAVEPPPPKRVRFCEWWPWGS